MIAKKTISKRITNNLIIFIISIFLSFILFYISKDTNIFQASVLQLQEIQEIQEKQRDIAFKNNDGLLDIFLSKNFLEKNYSQLIINIVYDYDKLYLNTSNISFQKNYTINSTQSGSVSFSFSDLKNISNQESFLIIPFSGSTKDILISEAVAKNGYTSDSLSIGNLTEYNEH